MASQAMKDYISLRMGGWDGTPNQFDYKSSRAEKWEALKKDTARQPDVRPVNVEELKMWVKEVEEFGRRVRRDILVLERLLIAKGGSDWEHLYEDPGDPPPPPDI